MSTSRFYSPATSQRWFAHIVILNNVRPQRVWTGSKSSAIERPDAALGDDQMVIEAPAIFCCSVAVWLRKGWPLAAIVLAGAYCMALIAGAVRPLGIGWIVAVALLAWICSENTNGIRGVVVHSVLFATAVLLSLHLLPGFHNPVLLGPIMFTPDAVPFKMYLNLDKAAVGFFLVLLYAPLVREMGLARALMAGIAGAGLALVLTLPVALVSGAVRWEPKYPEGYALWALDNFLIVALAEEALFRGFLQTSLLRWLDGLPGAAVIAIGASAIAFGALHFGAGAIMVVLATLAGVAYGIAYQQGGLLASMIAHVGLNSVHIILFTYPLLANR
jgi:uncharacterized protein